MARFAAFFVGLSLCAAAALAVEVDGIVAPEQLNPAQPTSSGSTCSVVLQPFTIYSPTFNSSLPTTSPVPPYVLASLSFAVYNQGSEAISAPWTLQLSSSRYQAVLQVRTRTWGTCFAPVLLPSATTDLSAGYRSPMWTCRTSPQVLSPSQTPQPQMYWAPTPTAQSPLVRASALWLATSLHGTALVSNFRQCRARTDC